MFCNLLGSRREAKLRTEQVSQMKSLQDDYLMCLKEQDRLEQEAIDPILVSIFIFTKCHCVGVSSAADADRVKIILVFSRGLLSLEENHQKCTRHCGYATGLNCHTRPLTCMVEISYIIYLRVI